MRTPSLPPSAAALRQLHPTGDGPAAASGPASEKQGDGAAIGAQPDHVAVLLLVDLAVSSRLWGLGRIMRRAAPLQQVPGLCFARVMGSGQGGGFGLRPSFSHQGLFALFDGQAHAERFIDSSPLVAQYRERADEFCLLQLRAWSSRGRWGGQSMAVTAGPPPSGPVAVLTRASIRPSRALAFWRHAAPSQAALAGATGCRLAAGMGEAPLLRQATFSLWDSVQAMDAYARGGAHLRAIQAAAAGGFFSESMFVRFVPLHVQGRWQGRVHD